MKILFLINILLLGDRREVHLIRHLFELDELDERYFLFSDEYLTNTLSLLHGNILQKHSTIINGHRFEF